MNTHTPDISFIDPKALETLRTAAVYPARLNPQRNRRASTLARYEPLRPILAQMLAKNFTQKQIAVTLAELQMRTALGGYVWHPTQVSRVCRWLGLKPAWSN
jgi:hypothetical protein